ncbi:hypothetical protein [Ramlibacter alkalitolerans]|uniref:Metalloprotease n=1 Tax=Ramlibacter alkalitolerans TaxID=2039631 RepID=A0ABS1JU61_9BURK|nr:hypothetical protein [Ramlibacter alkalitolerans]MBL0427769.1 hypothetical protein [Ramlibacter alkalitolerans]
MGASAHLRICVGLAVAGLLTLSEPGDARADVSGAQAREAALREAARVALATPAGTPGKWMLETYQPDAAEPAAGSTLWSGPFGLYAQCYVTYEPTGTVLESEAFLSSGLSVRELATFALLHEKGHCIGQRLQAFTSLRGPDGRAHKSALESVLEHEAFADAYALLWMSRRAPEEATSYFQAISRLRGFDTPGAGAEDDHYTAPSLASLWAEQASHFDVAAWEALTPDDIARLALAYSAGARP